MKKLFIMSHGLSGNGIDSFVTNIVKGFDKNKYDVSVILALDEAASQLREAEVLETGAKVYRTCDLGSTKRILIHTRKLYRILKENKPDIFHANMDLLNGLNMLAAWCAGVPVRVCHSHVSASQYELKKGRHIAVGVYRFIMRWLCKVFSNRRCGCSAAAMDYLFGPNWMKMRNACIVNNGVDTHKFSACHKSFRSCKHKIVTVGRLAESKNPFFALDVIEQLFQMRTDFEYIWVGSGELDKDIQSAIIEKGLQDCIHLLGARSDVEKILPQCDIFFLPSLFEGFGIVFIEAQAAGLPCLTSDKVPRTADCGGCVFLSLDEPASDWAQALCDMLDGKFSYAIDPKRLEKYDTSYTIRQLDALYEE